MKKMEFQMYVFVEVSKLFLKLFSQGKINNYTAEAKHNISKIKFKEMYNTDIAIFFFKNGTIRIYQNNWESGSKQEELYYEWKIDSDHKNVAKTLVKDINDFVKMLGKDDYNGYGFQFFHNFSYEMSKHKSVVQAE